MDVVNSAHCFGLLRLPKMSELGRRDLSGFIRCRTNTGDIKYKDKTKEKARIHNKTLGKQMKRKIKSTELNDDLPGKGNERMRNEPEYSSDDFEDDYRLIKKLKKGKISNSEFNEQFCSTIE